mgnify:CR=1 FL=1
MPFTPTRPGSFRVSRNNRCSGEIPKNRVERLITTGRADLLPKFIFKEGTSHFSAVSEAGEWKNRPSSSKRKKLKSKENLCGAESCRGVVLPSLEGVVLSRQVDAGRRWRFAGRQQRVPSQRRAREECDSDVVEAPHSYCVIVSAPTLRVAQSYAGSAHSRR